MEKIRLAEKSCYILLKYFYCPNLTKVMENKILEPMSEICIEVYRRLYVCKKINLIIYIIILICSIYIKIYIYYIFSFQFL